MLAIAIPRKELGTRAEARNREVERCLSMNPSYILMIDTDQTMPNRGYTAMLATGADVAIIDAPTKGYDDSNVRYHPDGTLAYTGISCCLIKATVFERIAKPWFSTEYAWVEERIDDGKLVWRVDKKYEDDGINEDIYFIRKCLESGLSVAIIKDLKCQHFDLGGL